MWRNYTTTTTTTTTVTSQPSGVLMTLTIALCFLEVALNFSSSFMGSNREEGITLKKHAYRFSHAGNYILGLTMVCTWLKIFLTSVFPWQCLSTLRSFCLLLWGLLLLLLLLLLFIFFTSIITGFHEKRPSFPLVVKKMVSSHQACHNRYACFLESILSASWHCFYHSAPISRIPTHSKFSPYLTCKNWYAWFLESCPSCSLMVITWFLHYWHVKTGMHGFLRVLLPFFGHFAPILLC